VPKDDWDDKANQKIIRCSNCRMPLFGIWKISDKKNPQHFQAKCWKCGDKTFQVKEEYTCRVFHVEDSCMVSADTEDFNGEPFTFFETVKNTN